jgi:putative endonuclease
LFSAKRNGYYIGSTGDPLDERIRKHNTNHRGYTGKTGDWKLVYKEDHGTKKLAYKRECEINSHFITPVHNPVFYAHPGLSCLSKSTKFFQNLLLHDLRQVLIKVNKYFYSLNQ